MSNNTAPYFDPSIDITQRASSADHSKAFAAAVTFKSVLRMSDAVIEVTHPDYTVRYIELLYEGHPRIARLITGSPPEWLPGRTTRHPQPVGAIQSPDDPLCPVFATPLTAEQVKNELYHLFRSDIPAGSNDGHGPAVATIRDAADVDPLPVAASDVFSPSDQLF